MGNNDILRRLWYMILRFTYPHDSTLTYLLLIQICIIWSHPVSMCISLYMVLKINERQAQRLPIRRPQLSAHVSVAPILTSLCLHITR